MRYMLWALLLVQQPLPPPFPRDGATKVLDNEHVVIWDVSWQKGKPTPLHEHRLTALSVTIQPGLVKSVLPDGTTRVGEIEQVGNVQYGGKGLVHREEGVSDTPRRVFLLELEESAVPPNPVPDGVVPAWPRAGATKVLDNDRVAVWDYTFAAGLDVPLHYHDKDQIWVELQPGRIRVVSDAGESRSVELSAGAARFVPRGDHHRAEHLEGTPRVIVVELKR